MIFKDFKMRFLMFYKVIIIFIFFLIFHYNNIFSQNLNEKESKETEIPKSKNLNDLLGEELAKRVGEKLFEELFAIYIYPFPVTEEAFKCIEKIKKEIQSEIFSLKKNENLLIEEIYFFPIESAVNYCVNNKDYFFYQYEIVDPVFKKRRNKIINMIIHFTEDSLKKFRQIIILRKFKEDYIKGTVKIIDWKYDFDTKKHVIEIYKVENFPFFLYKDFLKEGK